MKYHYTVTTYGTNGSLSTLTTDRRTAWAAYIRGWLSGEKTEIKREPMAN